MKPKLKRLQKKYNNLVIEHELTKCNFEDFAESSLEQTKELLSKIEHLTYTVIFRDNAIGILKSRIRQLEKRQP